ncbi:hypothetical protein [Nocardia sp. NPDC005998]|uniref:hypothetical protein n=1 Tax=Nocardia sp. NPDC005998 TaxID=3156894 RepID=UPI0033AA753E
MRALLAALHEDTRSKLDLAPTDSAPLYQGADGSLSRVEDGSISDTDAELDKADAITIQPVSVRDIEARSIDSDGPPEPTPL